MPRWGSLCHGFTRPVNCPAKSSITIISKRIVLNFQKGNSHAYHIFDETHRPDLYSLNARLVSYVRSGNFIATWALFSYMHGVYADLNAYIFTPVVSACAALPGSERGKQVHGLMIKTGSDLGTVAETALMDMYSKYGFLDDSIKVFERMEFKDVVSWNALLSSFLRYGLARGALGVFKEMRRERVEFTEFTLCSVLKVCASLKAFRQGKQVHGLVVVMGRDLVILSTALIDFYSNVGHIRDAMKVFSILAWNKDDTIHNSLISGCLLNRQYKEAFFIMSTIRPNVVALTSALAACSENSDLWIGKQIHCVALRFGFTCDTQLSNVLVNLYAKCGKIFVARLLFDGIRHKDVVSWTSMIDAYGSHGRGVEALELFKKMGEGSAILPNSVMFLAVLSACGHSGLVEEGRECFKLVRDKSGLDPGPEHYACFIDILGRAGRIGEVWSLFDDMIKNSFKPTAAVWAALLNACSLNLDVSTGEFAAKHLLELEPNNPANYVLLSNFYAAVGRWDYVDDLRTTIRKRGLSKEAGSSWLTVGHVHQNDNSQCLRDYHERLLSW